MARAKISAKSPIEIDSLVRYNAVLLGSGVLSQSPKIPCDATNTQSRPIRP